MKKWLVVAEKSSAGKDMAKVLSLSASDLKDGYMERDDNEYIVTWARGHLIGQKEPREIYGEKESWDIAKLPFQIDQETQLKVLTEAGAGSIFNTIKKLINRDDVEGIINAGDCGREGELIQQWIYKMASNKKPIKRLWVNDLTDESLKKGFKNLQPNEKYKNLYEEGKALKVIDYMYGMSYTVLLTKLYGGNSGVLHFGRCQTPLLNLIVERELEIRNFKKEKYHCLRAIIDNFKATLQKIDEKSEKQVNNQLKFTSEEEKNKYLSKWRENKQGTINKYEQKDKETKPDKCFSLSTLQQTLGKKYGYTPDKTLELAQSLYEKKLTSYPRTNSEYLSDELWEEKDKHIDSCISLIKSICGDINIDKNKAVDKAYVDNSKIEDHHAIIPTDQVADISKLSEEEKNAYIEICKRFIAIFMESYKYKSTEVIIEINKANFKATRTTEIDKGYKILYDKDEKDKEDDEEESYGNIPVFAVGSSVDIKDYELKENETKPEARYNVSSIIKLMEKYGIGTPATQSSIIENILNQKVIKIKTKGKKKEYVPTEKGENLVKIIPEELKSADLTKRVEERIKEVGKGNVSVKQIQEEIYNEQLETIKKLKEEAGSIGAIFSSSFATKEPIGKCPFCKSDMIVNSKGNLSHINYKDNPCQFTIWKDSLWTTITEKMMKDLITTGKTIGTFKSKAGKSYKQEIIINKEKQVLEKGAYINK